MRRLLSATLALLFAVSFLLADDPEQDPAKLPTKPAEPPPIVAGALVIITYKGAPKALPNASRTQDEAKARAQEALLAARAKGAAFAEVVKKYSDDPGNDGRVPLITPGRCTVPALEQALFSMEVGQIADVVECDFGYLVATRLPVVHAFHILLMYKGADRAPETVTRTKEEAKALADEVHKRVTEGGEDFSKVAGEISDCPSKARGGDLGNFGQGQMTKNFDEAVFALKIGEISQVVETEFGFHVIRSMPIAKIEKPVVYRASHILLMYRGSEQAPETVTRTKDEAKAQAEELLKRIQAGEDFAKLASEFSDCPSKRQGGDLGQFGKGQMHTAFEQALDGLQVGALSGIVETPFGYHIIKRTQ